MSGDASTPAAPSPGRALPLALAAVGVLLYAWWAIPDAAEGLDLAAFRLLNGLIGVSPTLDRVWASTNLRWFDAATFATYAVLSFAWMFRDGRRFARRRGAELFATLLVLAVARYGVDEVIEHTGYRRESPSMSVKEARMITDYVQGTKAKYKSRYSFPGDHALVSTWVAVHMALRSRRGFVVAALALTVTSWVPRMVVGGHWLTDNIVGGLGISLIVQGTLTAAGVLPWLAGRSERVCLAVERALGITWLGDAPEDPA